VVILSLLVGLLSLSGGTFYYALSSWAYVFIMAVLRINYGERDEVGCMKKEKWVFGILAVVMLFATVQGALAWSWFGLFPEKVVVPDVQFKSEPISRLDRLNNFFLSHNEFRSLPEGTSIGLKVGQDEINNHVWFNYILTEKGISEGDAELAVDAVVWVSQSFFERLLGTGDVCNFFVDLKLNPEEGKSYGVFSMRNVFVLRWKYGSGNRYCLGSGLWS